MLNPMAKVSLDSKLNPTLWNVLKFSSVVRFKIIVYIFNLGIENYTQRMRLSPPQKGANPKT